MCTVSIVRTAGGFRVVTNRDVGRARSPAEPPRWREVAGADGKPVRCAWPTDPEGGGTWIGANEHGLVLCLLNRSDPDPVEESVEAGWTRSRGGLIPDLMSSASVDEAVERAVGLTMTGIAPCRLVLVDHSACVELTWAGQPGSSGRALMEPVAGWADRLAAGPVCWASSGLGDHLVQCRLPEFEAEVAAEPSAQKQDRFHRLLWPDRSRLSPLMSRADARTVSITTVEVVSTGDPEMTYEPLAQGDARCDPVGAEASRYGSS